MSEIHENKETETCQEAIVVIGEASESEEADSDAYKSDSSLDSELDLNADIANLNLTSSLNSKTQSLHSTRSGHHQEADRSSKRLSVKEDHFTSTLLENSLLTERLMKDNNFLRSSIVNFGMQRYQRTINQLNELNQNLIKSQEKIQSTNQYLEKTKCNLNNLNDNLNEIFDRFNECKLKL